MSSIQLTLPFPPEVEWRDIPGYEGVYQVSNTGFIRRRLANQLDGNLVYSLLSIAPGTRGYIRVRLTKDGRRKSINCHRLVMLVFTGKCPEGLVINHKNGIKADNSIENLEYVTPKQNASHAKTVLHTYKFRYGTDVKGFRVALNQEKVREIRSLVGQGISQREVARLYSVSEGCVSLIIHRKTWKHVD